MSTPTPRRAEKLMDKDRMLEFVTSGHTGRLATIGPDGYPYCIPLLYLWIDGAVFLHTGSAPGHLRKNIEYSGKVCFELDEPGEVFDYGRFECDSGIAFRSIVIQGTIHLVEDRSIKQAFCEQLMDKYGKPDTIRPKNFFPRLDWISVYRIEIEHMVGKEQILPPLDEQWPAKDRTKTPQASPP